MLTSRDIVKKKKKKKLNVIMHMKVIDKLQNSFLAFITYKWLSSTCC